MKISIKFKSIYILFILFSHGIISALCQCSSAYIPRSTGNWLLRENQPYEHAQNNCWNGGSSISFNYLQSFHDSRIARYLFGTNCLSFAGSQYANRNSTDLIADQFGLSPYLPSTRLSLKPKIKNVVVDFHTYVGLDALIEGLYFKINAPLTYARWTLDGCVPTSTIVTTPFPATAMAQGAVNPASSIKEALSGNFLFGDMKTPWQYGKFCFGTQTKTRLADIDLVLGYDFVRNDNCRFAVFMQAVAPTGNALNPRYVFSPVIGNGKFWELGAGISAAYLLWDCGDKSLNFMLDGVITHGFERCHLRSFDYCNNGCLSRYLLLKEFSKDATGEGYTSLSNPSNSINFTTRVAKISIPVKGELLLTLEYKTDNLGFKFGYNLYGKVREKVCITPASCIANINTRNFGIRGCEGVYSAAYPLNGDNTTITSSTISRYYTIEASSSNATITNCGSVDYPQQAVDPVAHLVGIDWRNTTPIAPGTLITNVLIAQESSIEPITGLVSPSETPVLVSVDQLNPKSGASLSQLSNTIFATVNYTWNDHCYKPYTEFGIESEFGTHNKLAAISQWGIYLTGGLSY